MITAIIVTYFPNLSFLANQVRTLLAQVDNVVIIDNGSGADFDFSLKKYKGSHNVHLLAQADNLGIAKAQNIGIQFAKKINSEYIIFFDQDSLPGPAMIENLMSAFKKAQSKKLTVAAVAPNYRDPDSSELSGFVRIGLFRCQKSYVAPNDSLVEADFLIASGTLVPMAVLDSVGDMDSSLFIDHVDTEWCLRAKSKGYRLFGVSNALMTHSLGESRRRFWFLRWRVVSYHKPFRYYYIFRNSINLWKRNYMPLNWKFVDFIRLAQIFFYHGVFSTARADNLLMMWRGLKDGVRGVNGKMPC